MDHKLSDSNPYPAGTKPLGEFFSFVLSLGGHSYLYLLLMGGDRYPMELLEVRTSWPGHHDYQKMKITLVVCPSTGYVVVCFSCIPSLSNFPLCSQRLIRSSVTKWHCISYSTVVIVLPEY